LGLARNPFSARRPGKQKPPAIRGPGTGGLSTAINATKRSALIAPFWVNNQMSQYNPHAFASDDWAKVWYRGVRQMIQLIIWFINIAPIGQRRLKGGDQYTAGKRLAPEDRNYCARVGAGYSEQGRQLNYLSNMVHSMATLLGTTGRTTNHSWSSDTTPVCGVRGFARHMNIRTFQRILTTFLPVATRR
jgi:hypothetical protein